MDLLTQLMDQIFPVTPPNAPQDTARCLNAAEQRQVEAGELLEAEGEWKSALGRSIKLAAEASADPDCYADIAQSAHEDAAQAEAEYRALARKYAARTRIGNPPSEDAE